MMVFFDIKDTSQNAAREIVRRFEIAKANHDAGDSEIPVDAYDNILATYKDDERRRCLLLVYNNLGFAHQRKGRHALALNCYLKALDIAEKDKLTRHVAAVCGNIGNLYAEESRWAEAIRFYKKSHCLFHKMGNLDQENIIKECILSVESARQHMDNLFRRYATLAENENQRPDVVSRLNELGSIYASTSQWDKAIEYYEKALEACERTANRHMKAIIYNNLALVYKEQRLWDEAIRAYQKGIKASEVARDKKTLSTTYNNLGLTHKERQEYATAIEYFRQSLEIKEQIGDRAGCGNVFYNLAKLYYDVGEYEKAKVYAEKAREIDQEHSIDRLEGDKHLLEEIRLKLNGQPGR